MRRLAGLCLALFFGLSAFGATAAELFLRSGEIPVYPGLREAEAQRSEIGRIDGGRPAADLERLFPQNRDFYQIEQGDLKGLIRAEDVVLRETPPDQEGLIQFLPQNGADFFRNRQMPPPRLTNNGRYLINKDRAFFDLELERVVLELGPVTNSSEGQGVLTQTRYVSTSTGTRDLSRLIVYNTDNISDFREYSAYDYGLKEFRRIWPGTGDVIFAAGRRDSSAQGRDVDMLAIDVTTGVELFRHALSGWNGYVDLARMEDGRWLVLQNGFGANPSHLYLLDPVDLSVDDRIEVDFASQCNGGSPNFTIFEEARIVQFGMRCSDRSAASFFAGVDLDRFTVLWQKSEPGLNAIQYAPEVGYFHSPRYGDAFGADIQTGARSTDPRPFPRQPRGQSQDTYVVTSPDGAASVTFRGQFWVRPPHLSVKHDWITFTSGLRPQLTISRAGPGLEKSFDVPFPRQQWSDLDPETNLLRAVISDGPSDKSYFEWTLGQPDVSVAQSLPEEVFWISPPDQEPRKALAIYHIENAQKRRFNIAPLAPDARIASDGEIVLGTPPRRPITSCRQSRGRDIWTPLEPMGRYVLMNHCVIETWQQGAQWWSFDDPGFQFRRQCSYRLGTPPCRSSNLGELSAAHRLVETEDGLAFVTYGITADEGVEVSVQPPNTRGRPIRFDLDFLDRDFHLYERGNNTYNAELYVLPPLEGALRFLVRGVPKTDPKMRGEYGPTWTSTWIYRVDLTGTELGPPYRGPGELSLNGLIGANYIAGNDEAIVIAGSSDGLFFHDPELVQTRGHPRQPRVGDGRILMGRGYTVVPRSQIAYDVFQSRTGERLAALYLGHDGDALALLPSGFFSFNRISAATDILVRNRKTNRAVPLSAFADTFYRPDLVQAAFVGDPGRQLADARTTVSLADRFDVGAAPQITALTLDPEAAGPGAVLARAELTVGEGGLGWLLWSVNSQVVAVDESEAGRSAGTQVVTRVLPLSGGANTVSVQATNAARLQRSAAVTVNGPDFGGVGARGRVHLLSIAVQDYDDDQLDLAYPIRDAEAFEATLRRATASDQDRYAPASLVGREVSVTRLFDGDVTRPHVAQAFREIGARMHPNDVFVLFVAGHGLTDQGRFHFLASDIRTGRDPRQELAERGISQGDWNKWLSALPAQRSIVLFDACESGSALRMDAAFRLHQAIANGPTGAGTARLMMSASAETQYALEGHEGHGAFTSVVLDAFAQGDANADGLITISELSRYVRRSLPSLTDEKWSYRQVPQVSLIGEDLVLGSVRTP